MDYGMHDYADDGGDGGYGSAYDMKQEYGGQGYQLDQQQITFGAGLAGQDTHAQGDKWRQAFLEVAAAAGIHTQPGADPNLDAVLAAVRRLKQAEGQCQALQQQEAALQVQVSHLTLQNLELRRELSSGWEAAEPALMQARQLVLDPAIQAEFSRLRRELEDHKATISQLKETNDSLTFTAESKMGRALIKKTKMLADENEEMARQLKDGPAATQGALLAVERHQANELRKGLSEIKDHCTFLEEENEELNMLRFLNERQIQDLQAAAGPGGQGDGDRDRGDRDGLRPHHPPASRGRYSSRGGGGRGDSYGRRGRGRGDGGGRYSGQKRMR